MEQIDKITYWLDIALYDLRSAKALLKTKRYLYVGFMCHQVIEKSLKAYYWYYKKSEPPYTHNLLVLYQKSEITTIFDKEKINLINILMPLNIEARYPSNKKILLKYLSQKKCKLIVIQTEELYKWIKAQIKI